MLSHRSYRALIECSHRVLHILKLQLPIATAATTPPRYYLPDEARTRPDPFPDDRCPAIKHGIHGQGFQLLPEIQHSIHGHQTWHPWHPAIKHGIHDALKKRALHSGARCRAQTDYPPC